MTGKNDSKNRKSKTFSIPTIITFLAIVAVALLRLAGKDIKICIMTLIGLLQLGLHGIFGFGLILHQSLSSHPVTEYIDVGYYRSLQLKWLYIMRYHTRNNFLWEDWHKKLSDEIIIDLEAKGAKKDNDQVHVIPNFDINEIDAKTFYTDYVKRGRPAILRNAKVRAMAWNPDIVSEKAGSFFTPMRCPKLGITKNMSVAEYVNGRNATDQCYLDNNADIFAANENLHAELEVWRFSEHMFGIPGNENVKPEGYLFSQMFMGVFPTLGASFHCANFHNLFYMVHGRKKWTFVDSSNAWFVYPFFNHLMRFVASEVTWEATHAENRSEIIAKHLPLYRYAPKYEFTLEPGDLLLNPAWNWHMVENVDDESIGVASRWKMPAFFPYTNSLFSFLQFTSVDFWDLFYDNLAFKLGVIANLPYKPSAHAKFDGQMNFGRTGSMWNRREKWEDLLSKEYWYSYIEHLKNQSRADKKDYLAL